MEHRSVLDDEIDHLAQCGGGARLGAQAEAFSINGAAETDADFHADQPAEPNVINEDEFVDEVTQDEEKDPEEAAPLPTNDVVIVVVVVGVGLDVFQDASEENRLGDFKADAHDVKEQKSYDGGLEK